MCDSTFHSFLSALPKCEHHIHIEGSLMPNTLFNLASRNNILLPEDDPAYASEADLLARYERFTSLDDFLGYYYTGMSVLIQESDFEDLAWAYFQKAYVDGVVHAEIFFDPQAHTERGVSFTTQVNGLKAAQRRAESELKMSTQLICCFLRHLPLKSALDLYDAAEVRAAVAEGAITGIGLDSSETGFPPEMFTELYQMAKESGLRLTAHAGEEGPSRNVAEALSSLNCERIDHGIRLAEDPALMKQVAAKGTMLTVCPLSNVRLRCVSHVRDLPIRQFLDAGVKFSINSDDPSYFGGFILDNYVAIQEAFNLSIDEWEGICHAGIEGSWCSETKKKEMLSLLEKVVREYR